MGPDEADDSPMGPEKGWHAAVPDLVPHVPHVAFEVADLASELTGREILIPPNSPSDGVRVAFIVENGAPIELLEFTDPSCLNGLLDYRQLTLDRLVSAKD
jgi:hypothetical protein